MTNKPIFSDTSNRFKAFLFIGITLLFALLGMLTGMLFSSLVYEVPLNQLGQYNEAQSGLQIARSLQLFGQFGLFIFPPLFYSLLVDRSPLSFLGYKPVRSIFIGALSLFVMFSILPTINFLSEINQAIDLPDWLDSFENWMTVKEEQAAMMSKKFLEVSTVSGLLINLFMIAIVPAFGEEMVFRSVLQPMLIRGTRNVHLGILLTATLFGLMHFQFFGLFPRIVLGLVLGYFYLWSGSIWVPILMHLVNNGTAVLVFWLNYNQYIGTEMESFGASDNSFIVISSILITCSVIYLSFRNRILD